MAHKDPDKQRPKIAPAPFDLAVINIVEYLADNTNLLRAEYAGKLRHKNDVLSLLGIRKETWSDMRDHYRHVSTKALRQKQIIGILEREFRIRPSYIMNYPNEREMFKENILMEDPPEFEYGYTSIELRRMVRQLTQRIEDLEKDIGRKERELDRLTRLVDAQSQMIDQLQKTPTIPTPLKPVHES
jgi:predicted RNase H-like nuclease (RuvC/YqgF family)